MSAGERLATLAGPTAVLGIQPQHTAGQHKPQTVYNLEVQGQHVFRVTSNGLLVHNSYADDIAKLADDTAKKIFGKAPRGGRHGKTKLPWGDGLESHHLPPKSVNGLHPDAGPAIQMTRGDHLLTSSHGSRAGSAGYRSHIEDLLNQGRVREAMAIEIRDVRRAALEGSGDMRKYNNALKEMLENARSIGFVR